MKTGERRFMKQEELACELGLLETEMEKIVSEIDDVIVLSDRTLISSDKYNRLKESLESIINTYHEANPLADGIPRQELLSRLRTQWFINDDKLLLSMIRYLLDAGVIVDKGKSIALSGFKIEYTAEQRALRDKIAAMYDDAGIEMIRTDEVLAMNKDKGIVNAILSELADEGKIIKINPSYYISAGGWQIALDTVMSFGGEFTLADFRDKLGTSRKYAAEILPAFDKAGITVFNGTSRVAIKK